VDLKNLLDSAIDIILAGRLAMEDLDRESTTWDGERWSGTVKVGKLLRIHRG